MKVQSINEYTKEVSVVFKDETYLVRDNGAICRLQKEGQLKRKFDDVWIFGKQDKTTGYMRFNGQVVHKIVATAFHGVHPSTGHVVDHIDTNRRNNNAKNLRWVTRLENISINRKTLMSINKKWGSVVEMLSDPNRKEKVEPLKNRSWMPQFSFENLIVDSLTTMAKQENWKTRNAFPLLPAEDSIHPLWEYFSNLQVGAVFSHNKSSENLVVLAELSKDGSFISVVTKIIDGFRPYGHITIRSERGKLIHKSHGTFLTVERAIFNHKRQLELPANNQAVPVVLDQSFNECG